MKSTRWPLLIFILVLGAATLACKTMLGGGSQPGETPAVETQAPPTVQPEVSPIPTLTQPVQPSPEISTPPPQVPLSPVPPTQAPLQVTPEPFSLPPPESYDTDFPLPPEVRNFTNLGNSAINFQTTMTLPDIVVFYQHSLTEKGFVERQILHVEDDKTFSMVFDGGTDGKMLVIQGVDLGSGLANVNIRYEDL